jgi:hypothetical protein
MRSVRRYLGEECPRQERSVVTEVFINYRAKDQPAVAGAIAHYLQGQFGAQTVFRDTDSMQPGVRYPDEMRRALAEAKVLVAVIGPRWMMVDEATGKSRLFNPGDWVHDEIKYALDNGLEIVPVVLLRTPDDGKMPVHDDLPEAIRGFASLQRFEFDQRNFKRDMERLRDQLVRLAPGLVIPDLFVQPPVPAANPAPSTAVRPEYDRTPFAGRERELADLLAWATDSAATATQLVVGDPGSGRTRLAMELCDRMRAKGWLAGLVDGVVPAAQLSGIAILHWPLLMVVDDAEDRPGQLVALAEAAAKRAENVNEPTRLLLLTRSAGPSLRNLRGHSAKHVARQFGTKQIALTARGARPDAGALYAADRVYWRDHLKLSETECATLAVFGATVTLCAPASISQVDALLMRMPELLGEDPHRCIDWWSRLYPGPLAVNPLRPERVGLELVADTLAAGPGLLTAMADVLSDEALTTALTVLGRALPGHPALAAAVRDLLRSHRGRMDPLVDVVVKRLQDPAPLSRLWADEARQTPMDLADVIELLQKVASAPPEQAPMRGVALDQLYRASQKLTEAFPGAGATPPELQPLANAVTSLSETLVDFAVGVADPESGRTARGLDGAPLVPDGLRDVVAQLFRRHVEENHRKNEDM